MLAHRRLETTIALHQLMSVVNQYTVLEHLGENSKFVNVENN